jgi:hypothetical protein
MAKMLTLAQTYMKQDVCVIDPLRVCRMRAHQCTPTAVLPVLPVFLPVVPVLVLVLPLFSYTDVHRLISRVMISIGLE